MISVETLLTGAAVFAGVLILFAIAGVFFWLLRQQITATREQITATRELAAEVVSLRVKLEAAEKLADFGKFAELLLGAARTTEANLIEIGKTFRMFYEAMFPGETNPAKVSKSGYTKYDPEQADREAQVRELVDDGTPREAAEKMVFRERDSLWNGLARSLGNDGTRNSPRHREGAE